MKTKVTNTHFKYPRELPNGQYRALWSGYIAVIKTNSGDWILTTKDGVRGLNIDSLVTITSDAVEIETIK